MNTGEADYLLSAAGKVTATAETKPEGYPLTGDLEQSVIRLRKRRIIYWTGMICSEFEIIFFEIAAIADRETWWRRNQGEKLPHPLFLHGRRACESSRH